VLGALRHRPSLVSLVPAMLHRLLDAGAGDALAGPRAILVGGSPVSSIEVEDWTPRGLTVCPSYGLTETGSQVAVVPPGRARELAGTAGFVHSRASVEIDAESGRVGQLLVGGPVLTPGYLDGGMTAVVFQGEEGQRRLRTGDIGYFDGEALRVVGRADRIIITGGEKVSPEEVEEVLREHPGVRDAAVTGAADARYGSIVVAEVASDAGAATLEQWCRERLAAYKVPRRFRFTDSVSRSEDGKVVWRGAGARSE